MKNTFEIENAAYVDAPLDGESDGTVTYIAVCNGLKERINYGQYDVEAKRSRVRNVFTSVFAFIFFVSAISLIVSLIFMAVADFNIGTDFRRKEASTAKSVKTLSKDSEIDGNTFISDSYRIAENKKNGYVHASDKEQLEDGFTPEAASDGIEKIFGMSVENVDKESAEIYKIPQGVRVRHVFADGSASKIDLRDGDIIISVDGHTVSDIGAMYVNIVSAVVAKYSTESASGIEAVEPAETVVGNVCISIPVCVYRSGVVKMLDGNFDIPYVG